MGDIEARAKHRQESIIRMKALQFGDPVTNVCAGDKNPSLHAYFVAYTVYPRRNRAGITHNDHWAKCTDRKGKFWNTGIEVVYPGHLDAETRAQLWAPIWQAEYGESAVSAPGAVEGEAGTLPPLGGGE